MTCILCGADLNGAAVCPHCGFDPSLDYEEHLTLAKIDPTPSLATRRDALAQQNSRSSGVKVNDLLLAQVRGILARLRELERKSDFPVGRRDELSALASQYESLIARLQELEQSDSRGAAGEAAGPVTWQFDEKSGCLTIRGSGRTPDDLFDALDGIREDVRSVVVKDGVTEIGRDAFSCCENLTDAVLPESVTVLGASAFEGCLSLSEIRLPNGLTEIGAHAFDACVSLESIELPGSLTKIGDSVFCGCSSLREIRLPRGVTKIEWETFRECESLQRVVLPEGLTEIDGAFVTCSSLERIELPDSLERIGSEAFTCCGLESVAIPKQVTEIASCAFANCPYLIDVTIPKSVKTLAGDAFDGCESLKRVYYDGSPSQWRSLVGDAGDSPLHSAKVYYAAQDEPEPPKSASTPKPSRSAGRKPSEPAEKVLPTPAEAPPIVKNTLYDDPYEWSLDRSTGCLTVLQERCSSGVPGWKNYKDEIRSVEIKKADHIASDDYYFSKNLETVTVQGSLSWIGEHAFWGCDKLKSLTLPDYGITRIAKNLFYHCIALESFTVPNGVTSIEYYAFANCRSLKSISIPGSVSSIDKDAFDGCDSLETVHYSGSALSWKMLMLFQPNSFLNLRIKNGQTRVIFNS